VTLRRRLVFEVLDQRSPGAERSSAGHSRQHTDALHWTGHWNLRRQRGLLRRTLMRTSPHHRHPSHRSLRDNLVSGTRFRRCVAL